MRFLPIERRFDEFGRECVLVEYLTDAGGAIAGWWLAIIALTSLAAIDIPMQIIRLTMTDSTALDYSYGLPIMIGMFFVLLYPRFRKALVGEGSLAQA